MESAFSNGKSAGFYDEKIIYLSINDAVLNSLNNLDSEKASF